MALDLILALLIIITIIPVNEEYIRLCVNLFYQAIPYTRMKKENNPDLAINEAKRRQILARFPLTADLHISLVMSEYWNMEGILATGEK